MSGRRGLTIRAAEPADASAVAELLRAAGSEVDAAGLAERIEALRAGAGAVLVAQAWGPPSGVAALSWSWTLIDRLPQARLDVLIVDPEARRNGLARLLLKAASQAARAAGCGELLMVVPEGAPELRAFALATGFAQLGAGFVRGLRKQG